MLFVELSVSLNPRSLSAELDAQKALEILADLLRVAAAKAKAVVLKRSQVRIDGSELGHGRRGAGLAEVGPGVADIGGIGAFHDDREASLAVGGNCRRSRLVERLFPNQLECRPQVKSNFAVLASVQALTLGARIE